MKSKKIDKLKDLEEELKSRKDLVNYQHDLIRSLTSTLGETITDYKFALWRWKFLIYLLAIFWFLLGLAFGIASAI